MAVGDATTYTITGLNDGQAYRVTLVVAENLALVGSGEATFVDGDQNGAADAGASENVALITSVNGDEMMGAKTVPGGMDDPASPSGVFPQDGRIEIVVMAVGAGSVYPVAYTNGGASTFLEIDAQGAPVEPYGVGGELSVSTTAVLTPSVSPSAEQVIDAGTAANYTIAGLDDQQAYRITLVVAENLTPGANGMGTFVDGDANGAADAGPSETIALITQVNGATTPGAKTVPGGDDDPQNPTGVFPADGQITITVDGIGAGAVYPVAYANGGASTFLEIDDQGTPIEPYGVGGKLTVQASPTGNPTVAPAGAATIGVGDTRTYTIAGLQDAQAYRVTLVSSANITATGDGSATFVDMDANGAADAGPSETVGLITAVNGGAVTGAKTVPGGSDDPANPSGVFPVDGVITVVVTGQGPGSLVPVAYVNGGDSTFLEIDGQGAPIEPYGVGGALTVEAAAPGNPSVAPLAAATVGIGATQTYTITGLQEGSAYRITLVSSKNITAPGDGTATFVDGDGNGAADAGASENVALITSVNGAAMAGAKTVPGGSDDPQDPSGVFPEDGMIVLEVTGEGAGTVYPVAYTNQGASTFLEIDGTGTPVEPYAVGGPLHVQPSVSPGVPTPIQVGDAQVYEFAGLDEAQAYRVTLVVADNLTADGTMGLFVDNDGNGAADAGASENVALITMVNGAAVEGAKTVPAGTEVSAPTGVFPVGGAISVTVTGMMTGAVYPVLYRNGGDSTFLEIDGSGAPVEVYSVGGKLLVGPNVTPDAPTSVVGSGTRDYTVTGLDDTKAYRITLVVSENISYDGDVPLFMDADISGTADAGASENRALIVAVNGSAVTGAKTVPGGDDDPADPSGVLPALGTITFQIMGQGLGGVIPVVYENGGDSTFLEVNAASRAIEPHALGGETTFIGVP